MNRTNSESTRPSKAAEHHRTPRRWRVGYSRPNFRQVLECAATAALWPSREGAGILAHPSVPLSAFAARQQLGGVRGGWSQLLGRKAIPVWNPPLPCGGRTLGQIDWRLVIEDW